MKDLLTRVPFYIRLGLFIGYLMAIVYASLASPRQMPRLLYIPNLDKIVHLIMYLGFSFLGLWTLNTGISKINRMGGKNSYMNSDSDIGQNDSTLSNNSGVWANYLLVALMAVAWGFFMEVMQRTMGIGRHYSIYDLYANIAGVLIGSILYYLIIKRIFKAK